VIKAIQFVRVFEEPPPQCILTLPRIRIRSFRKSDLPALMQALNDPLMWRYFSSEFPGPGTLKNLGHYLATLHDRPRSLNFAGALLDTDEVIGCVNAQFGDGAHARSAEYGGWMARPYWGSGLARSATTAFVDWLFEAHGALRVFAAPFEANRASIGTLQASGFTFEGRLRCGAMVDGRPMDQLMYAKLAPSCAEPPNPPPRRARPTALPSAQAAAAP
jgi:[ribosomal protein S5]-alanine N-acetyltransferase